MWIRIADVFLVQLVVRIPSRVQGVNRVGYNYCRKQKREQVSITSRFVFELVTAKTQDSLC